ncbi:outer membrane beta-barrel protein [Dysgonomonas sp. 520]|uniref:outer membrane beta-barrel protein n=1 Tax=Dysgonomonas sp. 520 TaxID=2302931 RepID=UPI0013D5575E|nr:outer membrane beta-barrel protein [Dysgonomonas sp. 520]NDW08495.1 TonB-dependent receptor [Dysgonomonas sp. 520]
MKKVLFLTLLLSVTTNIFAQNKVTITGKVFDDKTKEAIMQASVRMLTQKDSTYVAGNVTNIDGKFSVPVNPGKYILHISYLGYSDSYTNVDAGSSKNLGNLFIKENSILLDETVIVGKAVEIMVKEDTVEYNADSYKVQQSAVVEDLLKKMPGAEVDSDGKITINGKEVKKILVDGKEFFSDDPKVASKNLPASMVNKLQVYDKKSDMSQMTGFDDGEEETVINLTVKKGMKQGVFGNALAGYGSDDRYEANAMVNYIRDNSQFTLMGGTNNTNNAGFTDFASSMFGGNRPPRGMNFGGNNGITTATNGGFNFATETSDKFKWGGNIRYGSTDNDVVRDTYTEYFHSNPDSVQFETKNSRGNNTGNNLGLNLRLEWRPDSATTIIFKPNFQYNKNENDQTSNSYRTWANVNDSINRSSTDYFSKGTGTNINGELDISRKLGKKGRTISFNFMGRIENQDSDGTNLSETYFYKDGSTQKQDQIFNQDNKSTNWRAYVSYVEPIGKNNFLQLSYSYRRSNSTQDKKTYKKDYGFEDYDLIDTASTRYLKNEFVNQQISLNFRGVREKYNYMVGFSVQPSLSESWETQLRTPSDTIIYTKNDVVNFAPMAQFNYMWSKQRNLRINYNGSVNQPSTQQLSAARNESDPLNIVYGNPDLKPSFTNRLRIRYRDFNSEKASTFMLMGNLDFTTNDIVNNITSDDNGKQETTYKNTNGNWKATGRVMYNTPFRSSRNDKWGTFWNRFSINTGTNISYSENKSFLNGDESKTTNLNISERLGANYRSDAFDFELRGNFSYSNSKNNLNDNNNRDFFNYGGSAETSIYLPWDFTVESDVTYSRNSGYSNGYEESQWLWNASLSKQLFKQKNGTIRIKIYDILKQRSNISQSSSDQYLQQSITNAIGSYFMVHFVYKFQIFKGMKASDIPQRGPRGGYGGGPGGHGGGFM